MNNDLGAGNKIYHVKINVRWDSDDKSLEPTIVENIIATDDVDLNERVSFFLDAYTDVSWLSFDYGILSVRD